MNHKSPLEFPATFPVKVMGRDTPEFHACVADIFAQHVAPFDSLAVTLQPSRAGRFVSMTVVFEAQSRTQLDTLYAALSGSDQVLMAL